MIDLELFRKYFGYLSPSDMCNTLNKTIGSEENKAQINAIKDKLGKLIKEFKSGPTSNAKKLEGEIICKKLPNAFLSLIN